MSKIPKEIEYKKPYRFYLICDKLCDLEGVEVKNQMIEYSARVSKEEFINNCAYSESLLEYENINERSDPTHGYYKSKVKGTPCYYVQYAGFEFIFIGNGLPDKEYWLEEMYESYSMKYIKLFEEHSKAITNSYLKHINDYNCNAQEINKGNCDDISFNVIKDVVGKEQYIDINDLHNLSEISENTVYEINDGMFWSEEKSEFKTSETNEYWNIQNLNFFGKPPFDYSYLSEFTLKGHVWIYYNSKHYDSESVYGVDNFWYLPIYKRQLEKIGIKY